MAWITQATGTQSLHCSCEDEITHQQVLSMKTKD